MSSQIINKSDFERTLAIASVKIKKVLCTKFLRALKGHLFERPRMKRIHDVPKEPDFRVILLKEGTTSESLPLYLKQFIEDHDGALETYNLKVGYEHLSVDEVLSMLLPEMSEVPSCE